MQTAVHAARFRARLAQGDPNAHRALARLRLAAANGHVGARGALAKLSPSSSSAMVSGAFDVKANMVPAAVGTIGGAVAGSLLLKPLWLGLLAGATVGGPLAVAAVVALAYAKGTAAPGAVPMVPTIPGLDTTTVSPDGTAATPVMTTTGPVIPSSSQNLVELANIVAALPPPDTGPSGGQAYLDAMKVLNLRTATARATGNLAAAKEILTAYQAMGTPTAMQLATILDRSIRDWDSPPRPATYASDGVTVVTPGVPQPGGAGYAFNQKVHAINQQQSLAASQRASAAASAAAQKAAQQAAAAAAAAHH